MPLNGVTRDIAFASAPHAAEHDKVAVHMPATFDPTAPFLLCLFLHGIGGDVSFEDHIQKATDQIATCPANALLVAPRFGPGVRPGTFEDSAGFSAFVAELQAELTAGGIAAPSDAPIVLVAFSGGWRPLNAVLKGLQLPGNPLADRLVGILLLDSVYGPLSSAEIIAWQQSGRAQTALLSIYGRDTTDNAPAANRALIETLKEIGPVLTPASWAELKDFPPGTVAFFEVPTPHLEIVSDGPPAAPIAAFLGLLSHRALARSPKSTSGDRIG
jgi:hypothetical protein